MMHTFLGINEFNTEAKDGRCLISMLDSFILCTLNGQIWAKQQVKSEQFRHKFVKIIKIRAIKKSGPKKMKLQKFRDQVCIQNSVESCFCFTV